MADAASRGKKSHNKNTHSTQPARRLTLSALTLLALAACGGGSGKPSVQATETPQVSSTTTTETYTTETTTQTSVSTETATAATAPPQPQTNSQTADNGQTAAEEAKPLTVRGGAFRSVPADTPKPYTVTINGHTHAGGKPIVLNDFTVSKFNSIATADKGSIRAYRQQHSIIAGYLGGKRTIGKNGQGQDITVQEPIKIGLIQGDITRTLPDSGKYTYNGQAFSSSETGRLNYQVDFNTLKGSGSVTGINETGTIALKEAAIQNVVHQNTLDGSSVIGKGIIGTAETQKNGKGDYSLTFFGPNAEEIGGVVYHPGGEIGVGGSRK